MKRKTFACFRNFLDRLENNEDVEDDAALDDELKKVGGPFLYTTSIFYSESSFKH